MEQPHRARPRPPLNNGLYHKQVIGRTVFVDGEPYLLPEDLRNSGHVYIRVYWPDVYLAGLDGKTIMKLEKSSTGIARAAL